MMLFDEIKCNQCYQPLETLISTEHNGEEVTYMAIYVQPHECPRKKEKEE